MQFVLHIFITEITPTWKNWQLPGGFWTWWWWWWWWWWCVHLLFKRAEPISVGTHSLSRPGPGSRSDLSGFVFSQPFEATHLVTLVIYIHYRDPITEDQRMIGIYWDVQSPKRNAKYLASITLPMRKEGDWILAFEYTLIMILKTTHDSTLDKQHVV